MSEENKTYLVIYGIINSISVFPVQMTDCKAVISTLPGQTLGSEGLQVSFSLSNIHMPRMWVENHPDKDSQVMKRSVTSDSYSRQKCLSFLHTPWPKIHTDRSFSDTLWSLQACMLVFYPDFKSSGVSSSGGPSSVSDVVILLDSSKSMQGDAMLNARRIALQVLKSLDRSLKINIISFSTG